jgi:hypothetical protein
MRHIFDYFEHKRMSVEREITNAHGNKITTFQKSRINRPQSRRNLQLVLPIIRGVLHPNMFSQDKYWKNVNGFTPMIKMNSSVSTDFALINGEIIQP